MFTQQKFTAPLTHLLLMSMTCHVLPGLIVTLMARPTAMADDLLPPPFRGDDGSTTFQAWEFNDPTSPLGAPDAACPFDNPSGVPAVSAIGAFAYLPMFNGKDGVICIEEDGDGLEFDIPNMPAPFPPFVKTVWVQVVFHPHDGSGVSIDAMDPTGLPVSTMPAQPLPVPNCPGWLHLTQAFCFTGCPPNEIVTITSIGDHVDIDQVVIDTACQLELCDFPPPPMLPDDYDGDGEPDDMDNAPGVPNPNQIDCDGDGIGNVSDLMGICPMGTPAENEMCGDDTNGGCNSNPPAFETLSCNNDAVCGTVWAENGIRDTDWYEIDLPDTDNDGEAQLAATICSAVPVVCFVLNDDCTNPQILAQTEANADLIGEIAECLPAPATYRIFIAPGTLGGGPICDDFPCECVNEYYLEVGCTEPCPIPIGLPDGENSLLGPGSTSPFCGPAGCPPGAIIESEPDCGLNDADGDGTPDDTVNGGCNSTPPVFETINCGDTFCGSGAFDGSFRDTDWFKLVLTQDTTITFSGTADFDILLGVVDNAGIDSCNGVSAFLVSDTQPAGAQAGVTVDLSAGTWYLFVAPQFNANVPCPTEYVVNLTCEPVGGVQACCFADGTCQDLTPSDCSANGGIPQGVGSDCATVTCPVAPDNDDCEDRIEIFDGDTAFSTLGATTDGSPDPLCDAFGDDDVAADIWYNYTATCTGELTVSTCDQADYDTKLAIYEGCGCPAVNILGCNDDGPGCAGFTSELTVDVVAGQCYKIRVGGFGGATGSGTLTVTCVPDQPMCPAQCTGDINGDASVDGADLGLLLGAFGSCPATGLCCEDLNGDNQVDGADLGLLLGAFGSCP